MKDRDIDIGNILLEEKTYKNILIYVISYNTFMGSKALRIWFDKISGFIKIYGGIRYLVLLGNNWYDSIFKSYQTFDRIKYLISEKSGITDSINHNFAGIRIDSYNFLPPEKMFHNVINSLVNKYENNKNYNF